ncbi:hypothetical protein [Hyphomicrobium sp.]|uniref:hypothetical protein n=1 Tax=Hyphomicrobium sp. TaxID=82 RepID=UPI0025C48E20|nr:hypothetical protein [Hyphomicrobium sp.]MCC7251487.1 hypothetical protein [Hyphomicrobium sp.]
MYQSLDPALIIATLEKLERRISERFPGSGLSRVSDELTVMARETSAKVAAIAGPNYVMRSVRVVLLIGGALVAYLIWHALKLEASAELTSIVQAIDAATSLLIVCGGLALYLWTLENRWRREQALEALHELRSLIHVIDMHQLTKDPTAFGAPRTSSSPDRTMTPFQLLRYLGYCSELLSLASKVAALFADKIRDPSIVDAVGDIERLTAHLSQKIWQKIELIQERLPTRPASDALAPRVDA